MMVLRLYQQNHIILGLVVECKIIFLKIIDQVLLNWLKKTMKWKSNLLKCSKMENQISEKFYN
jgi:hypothetical protein